ncbi:cytosine deaminase [Strigomonas culicis]|uniref:Cytosine deaminase n=1 Tax=Strigomonas culicis TaxID=28005 RepID=S9UP87_9TRYP|nr:cytosine deaminase [Strigomonas culicis]|eukprot:EPY32687.1 cytosine deaminase [Strigomonas culicis]
MWRPVRTERADGQPRAGEGLALDQVCGDAEPLAELAHLVLVVVAERFDDLARVAQLAHDSGVVVVCLDGVCHLTGVGGPRLDEIRPQRPLGQQQVVHVEVELLNRLVANRHERVANDGALLLRVRRLAQLLRLVRRASALRGHLRRRLRKVVRGVDQVHVHAGVLEGRDHLPALVESHKAVVDVDAHHALWAERLEQQHSADRTVHAAGGEAEDLLVVRRSLLDEAQRHLLAVLHREGEAAAADGQEVLENHLPVYGELHFGVELKTVVRQRRVPDARHDAQRARRDDIQRRGHVRHGVVVRQQHGLLGGQPSEELHVRLQCHVVLPVLARGAALHVGAVGHCQQLHPVADAQDRLAKVEEALAELGGPLLRHGARAAADDDALEVRVLFEHRHRRVERQNLRFHLQLPHAAVNHFTELRPGIQNGNVLVRRLRSHLSVYKR